jgi:hypothetical protein
MTSENISPRAAAHEPIDNLAVMLRPLSRALFDIYGRPPSFDVDALHAAFNAWLARGQTKSPSKSQAAAHECGHVVAYAAAGVPLIRAEIHALQSKPGAWLGVAHHVPLHLPLTLSGDPELFSLLACVTLTGPIAEEIIGGGYTLKNLTELWRARAFSDRTAELCKELSDARWAENVWRAVAVVEHYEPHIRALARILERRCEITPEDQKVCKVLRNISPGALIPANPLSPKGEALARLIIANTPCIAGFVTKESA